MTDHEAKQPKERRRGHGEGSFYQRADGRWVGSIRLGWEDGKRKRIVRYGKTKTEARAKITEAQRQHNRGMVAPAATVTVEQFLEQWLRDVVKPSKRASTYVSYEQIVRIHIVPGVGKIKLQKLAPQHVQQLLAKVAQKKRASNHGPLRKLSAPETTLSPRTVQYVRAVLRIALNQAMKWDMVERNVATLVTPPRSERYEVQVFDVEQARRFLADTRDERLRALFVVGLSLGLRHGEALALRWSDVNLESGQLNVRHTLQRVDGKMVFGEPKSESSRRSLNMPAVLITELKAHRTRQKEERLMAGRRWIDHDLVFPTTIGTPMDMRNSLRELKRVLNENNLPPLRFHDLRHTAATLLLAQGVQPIVIKENLGHSQIGITLNIYGHVLPSMKQDAADRMNEILDGGETAEKRPS